jgi:SAM-dependent methyltransferase
MPSLSENRHLWAGAYDWAERGEEWSQAWGGSEAEWFVTILPRIHAFLPTSVILEIAPGFGRWTQFLKEYARRLIAVDLSEECIAACQTRFAADSRVECHVNDGTSLAVVDDHIVDFAFSFDSLVHVDQRVIGKYLQQLSDKLTANGVAFIHHSNMGAYRRYLSVYRALNVVQPVGKFLDEHVGHNIHWRDTSMSAQLFERLSAEAGLVCISQELINWGEPQRLLNDAFSIVTPAQSAYARPRRRVENRGFGIEISSAGRIAPLYTRLQSNVAPARKPAPGR